MKGYEITGSKGTYLELEDGRCADTVTEHEEKLLEELRAEVTEHVMKPLLSTWTTEKLTEYVGA